jgi:hypothetical protein
MKINVLTTFSATHSGTTFYHFSCLADVACIGLTGAESFAWCAISHEAEHAPEFDYAYLRSPGQNSATSQ